MSEESAPIRVATNNEEAAKVYADFFRACLDAGMPQTLAEQLTRDAHWIAQMRWLGFIPSRPQ